MNNPWQILMGDHPVAYLLECLVRTVVMCVLAFLLFKLTGKKEVRQFSLLELLVVIGLGSALGDPMLDDRTPILPAVTVIAVVLGLYGLVKMWTVRARGVRRWVEGPVVPLLRENVVLLEGLHREGLSLDEFLGELRTHDVEHLGQMKAAYMEVDGTVSVLFRAEADVVPGLPTGLPEERLPPYGLPASCCACGHTVHAGPLHICPRCGGAQWTDALATPRVG